MNVSRLGLGTAALGRPVYINIKQDSKPISDEAFKQNAFLILDAAYKQGIRYFDTAPSYGKAESFLMEWQNTNSHPDVVFGTKWGYINVDSPEQRAKGIYEHKEHSLDRLLNQWEVSNKLRPELKFYQTHSATLDSGFFGNTKVLNTLKSIKSNSPDLKIGITTTGSNQSEVLLKAMEIQTDGQDLFETFQVTYNVFDQSTFSILKTIKASGKVIIIKEALANGRVFPNNNYEHYSPQYTVLQELSKQLNVGIDALAIRFVMDSLQPDYVLSGATSVAQLEQNINAQTIELTAVNVEKLKNLSTAPKQYWNERQQLAWN